jgi:hypothetical protein
MSDSTVYSHVEAVVRRYDDELNRAGFRTVSCGDTPSEWRWRGGIEEAGEKVEIQIALTRRFPYGPPDVVLPDRVGRPSWHRGAGGVLCLWDSHTLGDLPWMDVPGLLERVRLWIAKEAGGWSDDDPALDLEAYHAPHLVGRHPNRRVPLLVLHDWSELGEYWFQATMPNEYGRIDVVSGRRLGPQPAARTTSKRHKRARRLRHLDCVGVDLGEMTGPLVDTASLLDAMGPRRGAAQATLLAGRPVLAVCRYTRLGAVGLIGFWSSMVNDKVLSGYFEVAETSAAQRRRAGWHAATLADRTITVLGAGSVGSYLADLLHRSGVVSLTICDTDTLKPGNLVRHVAPSRYVSADKTEAVRAITSDRDPARLIETAGRIETLGEAVALLRDRDLVIDCTGDRLTWRLLLAASRIADRRFLHVAGEGHGQFGRVDVCPPFHGADPLPADDLEPMILTEREGGCGDPISPTPPIAAFETAAMGARLAVRMLAGEDIPSAGERRQLFPINP